MKFKALLKRRDRSAARQPLPSTQAPSSSSGSSNLDDKCGLHSLYLGPDDVAMAATGPDIIAVHGLNGDPFTTWTHENEKLWLRDFLPLSLPTSRVFTFGYSSEIAFTRSRNTLDDFARSLLNGLHRVRREPVRNPNPWPVVTWWGMANGCLHFDREVFAEPTAYLRLS